MTNFFFTPKKNTNRQILLNKIATITSIINEKQKQRNQIILNYKKKQSEKIQDKIINGVKNVVNYYVSKLLNKNTFKSILYKYKKEIEWYKKELKEYTEIFLLEDVNKNESEDVNKSESENVLNNATSVLNSEEPNIETLIEPNIDNENKLQEKKINDKKSFLQSMLKKKLHK